MCLNQFTKILPGMAMVATLVVSAATSAADDTFLKLDGIEGESKNELHKKEIDVLAWSWGSAKINKSKCVSVQDLSLSKYVDAASPKLIGNLATGQAIPNAKLTVRKGGERPVEYLLLEMSNVIVLSISANGSVGEDRVIENVTLNFGTMKATYTQQLDNGTLKPIVTNIANTCPT